VAIREGWKVLREHRWSCMSVGYGGAIQYPVNKWAKPRPRCGPLTVFDSRELAERFMWESWGYRLTIHRCQYKPSRLRFLWARGRGHGLRLNELPTGTRLANAVKTLE